MIQGQRPKKPENAPSIGFSDLLWDFVQRCWDGDMKLRPKVTEVATHLREAAANWDGLMPPSVPAVNTVSSSKGEMSDTLAHREFEIFVLLLYRSSNNGTGGIFPSSSGGLLERTTESQTTSGLFSPPRTLSTQGTEIPPEELQGVVTKPSQDPQPESQDPMQPESRDPMQPASRDPTQPRLKGPHDDLDLPIQSHLNKHYDPPPSKLPRKKRKPFAWLLRMFRRIRR